MSYRVATLLVAAATLSIVSLTHAQTKPHVAALPAPASGETTVVDALSVQSVRP